MEQHLIQAIRLDIDAEIQLLFETVIAAKRPVYLQRTQMSQTHQNLLLPLPAICIC